LTISNASTVSEDNRVRLSVIVIPVEEQSLSDCALEHCAASIRFATWLSTGNWQWLDLQIVSGFESLARPSLELTSKVTTEFAYNGTSRGLHKERYCRIDVISELKCI